MYEILYVPMEQGVYFHLYFGSERVNGGLGENMLLAANLAEGCKWRDQHVRYLATLKKYPRVQELA